jgi:hypothetical protein
LSGELAGDCEREISLSRPLTFLIRETPLGWQSVADRQKHFDGASKKR